MHHRRIIHKFFLAYCKYKYTIPNLVFNFLKHYRRPRTPLIRLYVRLSQKQPVGLSVRLSQKQPVGSSELKGAKGRLLAGESRRPKAGCFASRSSRPLARLKRSPEKLSSAPCASARLQYCSESGVVYMAKLYQIR